MSANPLEHVAPAPSVDPWPEHTKLKAISDKSQAIGEFVEWLEGKGIHLAEYEQEYRGDHRMFTIQTPITKLLAEFFDIDQDKIEAEKQAMLDAMREMNQS